MVLPVTVLSSRKSVSAIVFVNSALGVREPVQTVKEYKRARKVPGEEQTDNIITRAKAEEQA